MGRRGGGGEGEGREEKRKGGGRRGRGRGREKGEGKGGEGEGRGGGEERRRKERERERWRGREREAACPKYRNLSINKEVLDQKYDTYKYWDGRNKMSKPMLRRRICLYVPGLLKHLHKTPVPLSRMPWREAVKDR